LALGTIASARADDATGPYPSMSPVAQYRAAGAAEEIALARSAAPSSISGDASVLTLGDHGYDNALKGKNGFVCLVQRSWATDFADAGFWNPKLRAPVCFNAAAARSVLPAYLERTKWALAGDSKADMLKRARAQLAAHHIAAPESGAMAYMMSKQQYLGDGPGHWHSHLMFFYARTNAGDWGAGLHSSPVFAATTDPEPITTFFVLVPAWSDGTAAVTETH
jgi:hypothetical protein